MGVAIYGVGADMEKSTPESICIAAQKASNKFSPIGQIQFQFPNTVLNNSLFFACLSSKGGLIWGQGERLALAYVSSLPGFMGSASNTAPHTAAANMAYLLRTKEGIAHGESDKLIPPHNLPTQREI